MILWGGGVTGPLAAPGTYQVRLTADGKIQTKPLIVKRHPLYKDVSDADLQAQFDLAIQIRDKTSEANNAVIQIRRIKAEVDDRMAKSTDEAVKEAGGTLKKNLSAVEEEIYQVRNPERPGPAELPDQDQQPARVAAVVRQQRRRQADRQRAGRVQGPGRRAEGGDRQAESDSRQGSGQLERAAAAIGDGRDRREVADRASLSQVGPGVRASGSPRPFPVERNEIQALRRRRAKLPQHRHDLTSMIGPVIDDVLDHLPEGDAPAVPLKRR